MQALFHHFIEQSTTYSLLAVAIVAFLESLVLVGLLLPGALMMAALGALIGSGQLNFYPAWCVAIIGCLLADWLSFWTGWRFKHLLHHNKLVNKYHLWLGKVEYALQRHNMLTILAGRFIGPTRPLVPMVAGMLNVPAIKFAIPSLTGALLWPPVYFLPGILAGAAIDLPDNAGSESFKWLLLLLALLSWLAVWLCWRAVRAGNISAPPATLSRHHWRLLAASACVATLALLLITGQHPLMPVYRHLLWQVLM